MGHSSEVLRTEPDAGKHSTKFSTTILTASLIPTTVLMPFRLIPTPLGQNTSPWTLGRGKRKTREDLPLSLFHPIPQSTP